MFRLGRFVAKARIFEQVAHGVTVERRLNEAAEAVVERATRDAPRLTGEYSGKFRAVPVADVDGTPTAHAVSDDVAASIIEFGSVNNPPHRTLTRAAMSVGKFEDARG